MAKIVITITREGSANEMGKDYRTDFIGDLADLKRVQEEVNNSIDKILWSKSDLKKENEQAI